MSIVGADHWLFISSTGGLTAGRINAESSLFPYYTDDKVSENARHTGAVTCLHVERPGPTGPMGAVLPGRLPALHSPVTSTRTSPATELVFEEVNEALGLRSASPGAPATGTASCAPAGLHNRGDEPCTVHLLDGLAESSALWRHRGPRPA